MNALEMDNAGSLGERYATVTSLLFFIANSLIKVAHLSVIYGALFQLLCVPYLDDLTWMYTYGHSFIQLYVI